MRRSKHQRQQVAAQVCQRLRESAVSEMMLPMPHDIECIDGRGKISHKEWVEWTQRRAFHREKHPDYDEKFARPSEETAVRVWELLKELGFPGLEWPPSYHTFIPEPDGAERTRAAKQGLVIVLDTFLAAGLGHRQITYREVFDALCRGFSDHFATMQGKVDSVRDMRPETVSRCRRDLLLAGIVPKYLWSAVVRWSSNPLFKVRKHNTGSRDITRVLLLDDGQALRERYEQIIKSDAAYVPALPSGIKVSFAEEQLAEPDEAPSKVCAERPYNVVHLGDKSKELLKWQSAVTLYLDISAFRQDYDEARTKERQAEERLKSAFRIDARLSDSPRIFRTKAGNEDRDQSRWSKRAERVYYRSIELGIRQNKSQALTPTDRRNYEKLIKCRGHIQRLGEWLRESDQYPSRKDMLEWLEDGSKEKILKWLDENERTFEQSVTVTPEIAYLQMANAMTAWRDEVYGLLEEYDTARRHQAVFRHVYERVKDLDGLKEIHSGFRRLFTRRYQPLHFWPTSVTSKDRSQRRDSEDGEVEAEATSEKRLESYRSRWFKAKDQETGKPCELAGFDVSSSQMQIIAVFMGDEELEKVTMTALDEPSFKQRMAKWAWELHESGELELRTGSDEIKPYTQGGNDERLQELVKELLMRVSYGSTWSTVEIDQRCHPKTYGPGWERGSAGKFVDAFNKRYPQPARFRDICVRAAKTSYAKNKYQGIEFVDPFDDAKVRWNPVARDDEYLAGSDGDGLRISVPRGLPPRAARKKAQGRAIEGSDGLPNKKGEYTGDYEVDEGKVKKMAAPCLVHALDAYYSSLVMSRLVSRGVDCFVGIHDCWLVPENKIEVLKEAMDHTAGDWYSGLRPVYELLLRHLETPAKKGKTKKGEGREGKGNQSLYDKVDAAYKKWEQRISEGWRLRFRAKRVGTRPIEGKH